MDTNGPIVIERTYKAKLQELWDLWTTKDGFESWWGPIGFRADVQALDAREGGALRYEMTASTPEMISELKKLGRPAAHPVRAEFTELRPRERLVLTNHIDFLPGVEPYDSRIVVELTPSGDETKMRVILGPMHSAEVSQQQKDGFTSQLSKLDATLRRG